MNTKQKNTNTCEILGVKINDVNIKEAVSKSLEFINSGGVYSVFTPNSLMLLECYNNSVFLGLVNSADLKLPDGQGILWAAQKFNKPIKEKVAGVDYAFALLKELNKRNGSLFIYGGSSKSLEGALLNCKRVFPNLRCDGCDGFSYNTSEVIEKINNFNADVVFVCLGSPKQELFIYNNKDKFTKGLFVGLGGTVDIMSGASKRAPRFFIEHSLEWLWRICREPRRLNSLPKLFRFVAIIKNKEKRHRER